MQWTFHMMFNQFSNSTLTQQVGLWGPTEGEFDWKPGFFGSTNLCLVSNLQINPKNCQKFMKWTFCMMFDWFLDTGLPIWRFYWDKSESIGPKNQNLFSVLHYACYPIHKWSLITDLYTSNKNYAWCVTSLQMER